MLSKPETYTGAAAAKAREIARSAESSVLKGAVIMLKLAKRPSASAP